MGHNAGLAIVGNTYLEGKYSEIYLHISQDEADLQKLFLQFSFPGGIPSHASPETPGSIHEDEPDQGARHPHGRSRCVVGLVNKRVIKNSPIVGFHPMAPKSLLRYYGLQCPC